MGDSDLAQFSLQISAVDARDEELDRMILELLPELREMDVESVQLLRGIPAPMGSKSDSITLGSITWGERRTVKFKGKGMELEGSPAELQKLRYKLEKTRRKNER